MSRGVGRGVARWAAAPAFWDHGSRMSEQRPHDILAAEAFAVPAADPALEPPHDVLAADEFAVPDRDPNLAHRSVVLPEDPTGDPEPHDILAAESFPMPAGRVRGGASAAGPRWPLATPLARRVAVAAAFAAYRLLRRR